MSNSKQNLKTDWVEEIRFRNITRADLPALEWDGQYSHYRRLYADTLATAQHGHAVLWAADLPGKGIIGQVFVQLLSGRSELADGKERAYIYGFRIKKPYRNRGLGTRMMEFVERDLVRRGYRWVTLNVARDNPAARRLYERLGYQVIGSEPGEWSYRDEDGQIHRVIEPAWRMEKQLDFDHHREG